MNRHRSSPVRGGIFIVSKVIELASPVGATSSGRYAAPTELGESIGFPIYKDVAPTALSPDAHNPNGQFVNFDPNWSPSGNPTDDCIYLRDRLTDLYNIEAR